MFTDLAIITLAAVILLTIAFGVIQAYSGWIPAPVIWAMATLLLGLIAWNRGLSFLRHYRRGNAESRLPFEPDPRYRVQVHCWSDQTSDLQLITTDAFEPEQFRALLPDARWIDITRPFNWTWPWAIVWIYFQVLLNSKLDVLTDIGIAVGMAVLLWLFRLPTYVRFVPGRVEILRYPILRSREARRQTFSLRGRVTVSTKGAGSVQWTDERGIGRVLPFLFVIDRAQARRAALAAALSQASMPALDE